MDDYLNKNRQIQLFSNLDPIFPSTRYQGSKAKLVDWIWENIADLNFQTFLDAFGGTGVVSHKAKVNGKTVTYNDLLKYNYYFGIALIENRNVTLSASEIDWLLDEHPEIRYSSFIFDTFHEIYFTDKENKWIDRTIANIYNLRNVYKFSLALFALSQACIVKRPYNLFHRKNLYLRFADVKRSFGNKTSWDRPFDEWFIHFINEANRAVFDNDKQNRALNLDAINIPGFHDLVYIDTPYISNKGVGVNYHNFYHFLEGLAGYYTWRSQVDYKSKHRRMIPQYSEWNDKRSISESFDRLFDRYKNSIIVVSYRSDGIPSEKELLEILKKHKSKVSLLYFGQYKYALSKNNESKEILLIGE